MPCAGVVVAAEACVELADGEREGEHGNCCNWYFDGVRVHVVLVWLWCVNQPAISRPLTRRLTPILG